MKRKQSRFVLLLAAMMVMGMLQAAASNTYVNEVFDNWVTNGCDDSVTVSGDEGVRAVVIAPKNKALALPVREGKSSASFACTPEESQIVFSLQLKKDKAADIRGSLSITEATEEHTLVQIRDGGRLFTHNGKELGGISETVFTRVDIVYTPDTNRYSVYVDGTRKAFKMQYAAGIRKINGFKIEAEMEEEAMSLLVDNVRVYGGSSPRDDFAQKPYNEEEVEWTEPEVFTGHNILVNDNYNAGTSSLTITKKTNQANYVKDASGNQYLEMVKDTDSDVYIDYSQPITVRHLNLELDLLSTQVGAPGVIQLRDTSKNYSQIFSLQTDGTLKFQPNGAVIGKLSKNWINLKVSIDLVQKTISLWVNGEEKYTGVSMANGSNFTGDVELMRVTLSAASGMGSWGVDNLKLYTGKGLITEEELNGLGSGNATAQARKNIFPDNSDAINLLKGKTALQMGSGAIYKGNEKISTAVRPIILNNIPMVPARTAAQLCNLEVSWDEETETVSFGEKAQFKIGETVMTAGDKTVQLPMAAFLKDGSSFVPIVTLVKEALGRNCDFYDTRGLVIVGDSNNPNYSDDRINTMNAYLLYDRPSTEKVIEDFNLRSQTVSHPRVIATAEDFARIKETVKTNEMVAKWVDGLLAASDATLTADTAQYLIPDGKRLLNQCRVALKNLQNLSFGYQMTGDKKYVDRAWKEIQAVGNFPNWNPTHFLDVGEMTAAVAIAYDWMYDAWTADQKAFIEKIIREFGLMPAEENYYGGGTSSTSWAKATMNWNVICNGGVAMGALAIFETDPEYCSMIVSNGVRSTEYLFDEFAPDGGYVEGPGYWDYCVQYMTMYFAALESALGTDYNLPYAQGISKTAEFALYADSTVGYNDYGDSTLGHVNSSWLFYLGDKFNNPGVVSAKLRKNELLGTSATIYDPIFYKDTSITAEKIALELDGYFRGPEFVSMRDSWDTSQDRFLSFHGGLLNVNHYHVDSGSFVYYAMGQPWAVDIGTDNVTYAVNYGIRNDIYRVRAEGHNSIVINPSASSGMELTSFTPVTEFVSKERGAYSVMDLAPAYGGQVTAYQRGYMLSDERRGAVVRDEVTLAQQSEVYWFMHTGAQVELVDDHTAILTKGGKEMKFEFITNAKNAEFSVMNAEALPTSPTTYKDKEASNAAYRKLAIKFNTSGSFYVQIRMIPVGDPNEDVPLVNTPIEDWSIPEGELKPLPQLDMIYVGDEPLKEYDPEVTSYSVDVSVYEDTPEIRVEGDGVISQQTKDGDLVKIKVYRPEEPELFNMYSVTLNPVDPLKTMLGYNRYPVAEVIASDIPQPENPPENINDDDLATRWASSGDGKWITIDLGEAKPVDAVAVAMYYSDERTYDYVIEISQDGVNYETVGKGSGTFPQDYRVIQLPSQKQIRYVRYSGNGSDVNAWNSVLELGALVKK